jgi:hypothetical protein
LLGISGADAFGPDVATEAITGGTIGTKR